MTGTDTAAPLSTIIFDVSMIALSSIVHRDDQVGGGSDTYTLFRREKVVTTNGQLKEIPLISGGSFRGSLRRISESLTASILEYEERLPTPAAHLLTNGGRLAKASSPLTDEQERTIKTLIPHLALFGGAASARIMSGLLAVEKVLPEAAEVAHLLQGSTEGRVLLPVNKLLGEEKFTHLGDARASTLEAPAFLTGEDDTRARVAVEVLRAGTRLHSRIRLPHATPLQIAYFQAVLAEFATDGTLGGRRAAGHGRIQATITATAQRGRIPIAGEVDWAAEIAAGRSKALNALQALT